MHELEKKKNIIFILVDGLSESMIDLQVSGTRVCPFLHDIGEKYIRFKNIYSQGTYTMSAVNSLFTSEDTIHDDIYDSFFSSHKRTVFELLIDEDYEMFVSLLGFALPSRRMIDGIDHLYLFDEENVFSYFKYVFDYYNRLSCSTSKITERDYRRLEYFLNAFFEGLKPVFEESPSITHLWRNKDYPWEEYKAAYDTDYTHFLVNKRKYTEDVLSGLCPRMGSDEIFQSTGNYLQKSKLFIGENYYTSNRRRIQAARFRQIIRNGIRNGMPIHAFIDYLMHCVLGRQSSSEGKEKLISYLMRVVGDCNTKESFSINCRENRGRIVAENLLTRVANDINHRKPNRPFFTYVHLEDTHQPFDYFSLLDEASLWKHANKGLFFAENLGFFDSYRGAYPYLFSASYVDQCIHDFIEDLRQKGNLENTILVVTSDHGTVFGDSPIRGLSQANNYHYEGYHVPCIIADFSNKRSYSSDDFYEAKDIFPTVFALAGMKTGRDCEGMNMMNNQSRGYSHGEHLGAGVADIYRKPILYTIRNERFLVVCKTKIEEDMNESHVEAIYDLEKDKNERFNKKENLITGKDVRDLIQILGHRHAEIIREYL